MSSAPATFPPCFESAEGYQAWRKMARAAGMAASPCTDCTAAYSARMGRQGRCDPAAVRVAYSWGEPEKSQIERAQERGEAPR